MSARPDQDAPPPRRQLLREMFDAAVARAAPGRCLPPFLPVPPKGRTVVVGAGKAAASMAVVVEQYWSGPLSGIVVTRHGHDSACERITVSEAAHPLPDASSMEAADAVLAALDGLTEDDLVLCLLSGGGSSLLVAPPNGVTLDDLRIVSRGLLNSGADIASINCVRRHLSKIAGGRLALAARPARLVTLAISDVPDDDPATIASGPTVADASTSADALAILHRYHIAVPARVRSWLECDASETVKPGDLPEAPYHIVASAQGSLEAAAQVALSAGYAPLILGGAIEGEARHVAADQARIVRDILRRKGPVVPPCVLISGGETSVTVRGTGRGGRNIEFLLALAVELDGAAGVDALAADTDGIDGGSDSAGACIDGETLARARAQGLDVAARLADNDGHGFFAALGDLLTTGPTQTNVNDFRAILIDPAPNGEAEWTG